VPDTWSYWTADIKILHLDLSFIPVEIPVYILEATLGLMGGIIFSWGVALK
jgi:hypothetical protein